MILRATQCASRTMYKSYSQALQDNVESHCEGRTPAAVVPSSPVQDVKPKTPLYEPPMVNTTEELTVEEEVRQKWEKEQNEMVKQVITKDVDDWSKNRITTENADKYPGMRPLKYIGGVDISFIKGDNVNACAAFVVLQFPELEVVYEDLSMVKLTAPYIPGYLAFREADFLVEKIRRLQNTKPALTPQVIMSDGNGILHPRKYGIACHLGVLTGIPQLGAAKNLFAVRGIKKDDEFDTHIRRMTKGGDAFPIKDEYGEILAAALKAHDQARNPVFVSPGHKLSVNTAVWVAHLCTKYRVPEPTRQADIKSREYLRIHFPTEKQIQQKRQPGKPKRHKSGHKHEKKKDETETMLKDLEIKDQTDPKRQASTPNLKQSSKSEET